MSDAGTQAPEPFSIRWILECGCEPEIEHCDQCDERRKLSRQHDHEMHIAGLKEQLEQEGYQVLAPGELQHTCSYCSGSGRIKVWEPVESWDSPSFVGCTACDGTGYIRTQPNERGEDA